MTWDFHSTFGRNVLFQNESSKFGITSTLLFDQPLAMVYLNSTLTLLFTESLDASTRLEKNQHHQNFTRALPPLPRPLSEIEFF